MDQIFNLTSCLQIYTNVFVVCDVIITPDI